MAAAAPNDRTAAAPFGPTHQSTDSRARIGSVDMLRGLVMIVMALDHTREYFHAAGGVDPTDPLRSSLLLFGTRWVTYFCAPTFVFLSGLSAYLRLARSSDKRELSIFLASRGVWLIFLELTLVGFAFTFQPGYLFLQIIWVIGAAFLALAFLCRLPTAIIFAVGILIVAGHNLLDYAHSFQIAGQATSIDFLDGRFNFATLGPLHGVLIYSMLGWTGILLAGFGAGPIYEARPERRQHLLITAGAALILAFIGLRLINRYGDPVPWSVQETLPQTLMSFLRVSKYPPSLAFTLATLGPMLILLARLERSRAPWTSIVRTYGRVPFFYYLLHIFFIHGAAAAFGMAQGLSFAAFTDPLKPPADFGVSLPVVYLLWGVFVFLLYFPCRWFERLRQRRSDWWLSYL